MRGLLVDQLERHHRELAYFYGRYRGLRKPRKSLWTDRVWREIEQITARLERTS